MSSIPYPILRGTAVAGSTMRLLALGLLAVLSHALRLSEHSKAEVRVLSSMDREVIRKHVGLYRDKTAHPEFSRTVLVTASNLAFTPILDNWQCQADRLGLDYVVIAFDPEIYKRIGKDRSVFAHGSTSYTEPQKFRQGHFNEMSCLKLRIVMEIMDKTGFNVVFSDPDNVFRADPFAPNVSLGAKMRLNKYDYIYQQNHGRRNPPTEADIGAEVNEANTGFYFVSSAKSKGIAALFHAALRECDEHRAIDDQTNFWEAVKKIRDGRGPGYYGPDNFQCTKLCGQGRSCTAADKSVLSYCEMDPFNHATGWEIWEYDGPKSIATFHGNYIGGTMDNKIGKLRRGGFWDEACVQARSQRK